MLVDINRNGLGSVCRKFSIFSVFLQHSIVAQQRGCNIELVGQRSTNKHDMTVIGLTCLLAMRSKDVSFFDFTLHFPDCLKSASCW